MNFHFFLFISLIVGSSCNRSEVQCIRPYTKLESAFIAEYNKNGFDVKLERFNYPYGGDSVSYCTNHITDSYRISIKNEFVRVVENVDSMRLITRDIASRFYMNIVEDSILFYTDNFVVDISSKVVQKAYGAKNSNSTVIEMKSYYSVEFKKEDLEEFCEFRVIESNNKLVREKVAKTRPDLPVFSESISKR